MSVSHDGDGYFSTNTGLHYSDYDEAIYADQNHQGTPETMSDPTPSAEQVANAAQNHMRYTKVKDGSGVDRWVQVPMSATEADEADLQSLTSGNTPSRTPTNPNVMGGNPYIVDPSTFLQTRPPPSTTPAAPAPAPVTTRAGFTNEMPATVATRTATQAGNTMATPKGDIYGQIFPDQATRDRVAPVMPTRAPVPAAPAPPAAPQIDRTKIDSILGGLNTYGNDIYALSKDNTGLSAAEAQLMKADQLARIRARDELAANQAGSMGAARSARNAGDRRLLERQAVGEQAYLGSQAQRADTLRQAELEGNLATVRATEQDADRRFRLDALGKAADLGLNTAALEVDIGKANLGASTQLMNNTFQELLAQKQIDESQYEALLVHDDRQMQNILAYTQAMAAIQFQYDQMSVQDQQALDQLMMQKYQIDTQKAVALKQIKEQGKFQWDEVLGKLVGGVGTGATGGIFSLFTGSKPSGGTTS